VEHGSTPKTGFFQEIPFRKDQWTRFALST
jgi:hypothetical protein